LYTRPKILILDGVTGSGKSEILAYAREHPEGRYLVLRKITTRPRRRSDNEWEFIFAKEIVPSSDTLEWGSVGARYAISLDEARSTLTHQKVPIFICTEPHVIASLTLQFDVIHLYLHRPMTRSQLLKILSDRGLDPLQSQTRIEEHTRIGADYLAKLPTITATILNIGDITLLRQQFDRIIATKLRVS
jgi:guanylate kinase